MHEENIETIADLQLNCMVESTKTGVQSYLAKVRIADLSPLATANRFVRSAFLARLTRVTNKQTSDTDRQINIQTDRQTHRHTCHTTCDIDNNRRILCKAYRRYGLKGCKYWFYVKKGVRQGCVFTCATSYTRDEGDPDGF